MLLPLLYYELQIMLLSAKHTPIRRLVARLLGNNEFRGILHSCGAVADICNDVVLPGPDLVSEDLVMTSYMWGKGRTHGNILSQLSWGWMIQIRLYYLVARYEQKMHMAIAVQMLLWAYLIRRQLLLAPWII
jgi:hypothetical protein